MPLEIIHPKRRKSSLTARSVAAMLFLAGARMAVTAHKGSCLRECSPPLLGNRQEDSDSCLPGMRLPGPRKGQETAFQGSSRQTLLFHHQKGVLAS